MNYKIFGKSGMRVSELCLGTMSFGQDWPFGADEKVSHEVLDAYAGAGGNFLDTANKYHNGQTEEYLGRWLTGKRDRMVVASKYTLAMDHSDPNSAGNHRKNMIRSVEASLRRLKTDYIDLYWVHAYDEYTPYEETMRALDDLVRAGKILHIGISDTPAWAVSAGHVYATLKGWSPVVAVQLEYNLLERTSERGLHPMARHHGMAVTAWGPLAGGVLSGKYTRQESSDSLRIKGNTERGRTTPHNLEIARAVDKIADHLGTPSSQVAIAWIMSRGYQYFPVVGARKVSQILDVMAATRLQLPADALRELDAMTDPQLGFPHDFLASEHMQDMTKGEIRSKISFPSA